VGGSGPPKAYECAYRGADLRRRLCFEFLVRSQAALATPPHHGRFPTLPISCRFVKFVSSPSCCGGTSKFDSPPEGAGLCSAPSRTLPHPRSLSGFLRSSEERWKRPRSGWALHLPSACPEVRPCRFWFSGCWFLRQIERGRTRKSMRTSFDFLGRPSSRRPHGRRYGGLRAVASPASLGPMR
jgi:hypothetical protein